MVGNRVTSHDVAKAAGVSRTTVSLVLNGVQGINIRPETRRRVIEVAAQLGYVPNAAARALVSQRAQIIGLFLTRSSHHISSDAFITQTLEGLLDVVHQYDMRLMIDIIEPEHQRDIYLEMARAKRIDGILLSGPRLDDEALQLLEKEAFPTVLIGQLPGSGFCFVDVDNCASAEMAVAHLIQMGHTRIACITNANRSYTAAVDRLRGYKSALEAAGLPFDAALVRYGDFTVDSGYQQMKDLLDRGALFTAAFVASDTLVLGAKAALTERGLRVPQDVALVGFDDLPFAKYMNPPLTTVHLPAVELAREACKQLICQLQGEQICCQQIILDSQLVIRQSCGASVS
jgi:LacI family transcriptional regulator, galactose operon repressor